MYRFPPERPHSAAAPRRTRRTSALPRLHRRTPILKEAKAEYQKLK